MASAPNTQAVMRLDLHLGESAISKTLSYFKHNGSGSHGVFKTSVGVTVGPIWHSRNAPGSKVAVAEFVVRPDTVLLHNVNAEVRIATPDNVSFIRLPKPQSIAIRFGDIISIDETLFAVHYPQPPPQPIPAPRVDPRKMRLFCSDMSPQYVQNNQLGDIVGRYRSLPDEQQAENVTAVRHELDQPATEDILAKPSLFGSTMPASQDFKAITKEISNFSESQVPAANALYRSCAVVESQEPGALKPSGATSQSDTQLFDGAIEGAMEFLQPVTGFQGPVTVGHAQLTTSNLAKVGNNAISKTTQYKPTRPCNKAEVTMADSDAETASFHSAPMVPKEGIETKARSIFEGSYSANQATAHGSKPDKQDLTAAAQIARNNDDVSDHIDTNLLDNSNLEDHTGDTDLDIPAADGKLQSATGLKYFGTSLSRRPEISSVNAANGSSNELGQAPDWGQGEKSKDRIGLVLDVNANNKGKEYSRTPKQQRKRKRSSGTSSALLTIEVIAIPTEATPRRSFRAGVKPSSNEATTKAGTTSRPPTDPALTRSTPLELRQKSGGLATSVIDSDRVVNVCFSGNIEDVDDADKRLLRTLGVNKVESVPECEVFLIKAGQGFKRTCRTLPAIALGKTIVTDDWLIATRASRRLEECDDYVAEDPKQEAEWGTTIKNAVARYAAGCKPFKDMTIRFSATLQKEYGYSNLVEMEALLKASGAVKVTIKPTKDVTDVRTILVGTDNKKDRAEATKIGCKLYSKDLIAMGVLRGDVNVEDNRYLIFPTEEVAEEMVKDKKPRSKRKKI